MRVTAKTLKNTHFFALLLVSLILGSKLALAGRLIPDRQTVVLPSDSPAATILSGKDWSYTVPFSVHNKALIEKLVQCESQGVNVSRPDSNGLTSWGLLQFNRTSTWADMEQRFNFTGSPLIPDNAIHMKRRMPVCCASTSTKPWIMGEPITSTVLRERRRLTSCST